MSADRENEEDATRVVQGDTFNGRVEEASDAPPCLVCLVGPAGLQGRQWPLHEAESTIGRSVKMEVYIDDASLSRSHAKLQLIGTDVVISDLKSTNKTYVNDVALPPLTPKKLDNNDQIKTGNVVFKYLEMGSIESIAHKESYIKSNFDSLTGCYNKGALLTHAPEMLKKAMALGTDFSIVIFDIDFFKKVNDTYGHPAGDYVLQEMSRLIRENFVRSQDFLARYGGEEFVLLLPDTPTPQAQEIAETIRGQIEGHTFTTEGQTLPITISMGITARTAEPATWEQLFKKADEALYASKNNGRNQVTVSS